jgi:hypothetical protein
MKTRGGFVSNSSSTSFIITNLSNRELTVVDFVKENPDIVRGWNVQYLDNITQKQMIESAKVRVETEYETYCFAANKAQRYCFGDEDGDLIGQVFDYMLRDGGRSKNFVWHFDRLLR